MTEPSKLTLRQEWKRGLRLYAVVTIAGVAPVIPLWICLVLLQMTGFLVEENGRYISSLVLITFPALGVVFGPVIVYRIADYFGVSISEGWKNRQGAE